MSWTRPNLWNMLPAAIRRNDELGSGDLQKFVSEVFQPLLELLYQDMDLYRAQINLDTCNDANLRASLLDNGLIFEEGLTLNDEAKKRLAGALVKYYKQAGTEKALLAIVRILTSLQPTGVVTPAVSNTWVLGENSFSDPSSIINFETTDHIILGNVSDLAWTFQLTFSTALTDEQKDLVRKIVRLAKPAYLHYYGVYEAPAEEPTYATLGDSTPLPVVAGEGLDDTDTSALPNTYDHLT